MPFPSWSNAKVLKVARSQSHLPRLCRSVLRSSGFGYSSGIPQATFAHVRPMHRVVHSSFAKVIIAL